MNTNEFIDARYPIIKRHLSKENDTIDNGIVYIPVTKYGVFAGWTLLDASYFKKEQLDKMKDITNVVKG